MFMLGQIQARLQIETHFKNSLVLGTCMNSTCWCKTLMVHNYNTREKILHCYNEINQFLAIRGQDLWSMTSSVPPVMS